MSKLPIRLFLALLLSAPATTFSAPGDAHYEYGPATRDGTGKYYLGREISHVMGHFGAAWLERDTREAEERTDLLVRQMPVEADDVVADIGAGTGYFSFPIARRVPEGQVLAVDIQPQMLVYVEQKIEATGVSNVKPVLGSIDDPGLAPESVDLAFIVDAYHEFSHPREMGEAIFRALVSGGSLILIEYRGEDPSVPIKRLHKMTEAQARKEMEAIGFDFAGNATYLPQQHVLRFRKP